MHSLFAYPCAWCDFYCTWLHSTEIQWHNSNWLSITVGCTGSKQCHVDITRVRWTMLESNNVYVYTLYLSCLAPDPEPIACAHGQSCSKKRVCWYSTLQICKSVCQIGKPFMANKWTMWCLVINLTAFVWILYVPEWWG